MKKKTRDLNRCTLEFEFEFLNCFEIVVMRSIRIFYTHFVYTKSFMATSIETGKFNKQILPEYALNHK